MDQEIRKRAIGGSENPALFRMHETLTAFEVWARKKGGMAQAAASIFMLIGTALEALAVELYAGVTRHEMTRPQTTYQHPDRKYMIYSPDALCLDEKRGLEVKVSFNRRDDVILPQWEFQCWWYMAALDYPFWDLFILQPNGQYRIVTIERLDVLAERTMLARVAEWCARYLEGDEQPPYDDIDAAIRWQQHIWPDDHRPSVREATPEEAALLNDYIGVRTELQKLDEKRRVQEIAIKQAIANTEGLRWDGAHEFTWRKAADAHGTDWQSMAIALSRNFIKDEQERAALEARYARTKPGVRRIHVRHPALKKEKDNG